MEEGLYIDVVSKTIISQLSESMAQFVGDSVSKEIKKVFLTKLPGVIGDEITPIVNRAQENVQEAAEQSGKKVLDQLKDIKGRVDKSVQGQKEFLGATLQGHLEKIATDLTTELDNIHKLIEKEALDIEEIAQKIIAGSNEEISKNISANSKGTNKALNSLESFIKTEFIQIQTILANRFGEKHDDLHDKIVHSMERLLQDRAEKNIDVEKLQIQSNKMINVLDARNHDLEKENAQLVSALNECITSAENLQAISQKKIDAIRSEKAAQELNMAATQGRINVLEIQIETLNKKLSERNLIVENAAKEKAAMEKKLIGIQRLWERNQSPYTSHIRKDRDGIASLGKTAGPRFPLAGTTVAYSASIEKPNMIASFWEDISIPDNYSGRILTENFSLELKTRVAQCIGCYQESENTGNPAIQYLSAWKEKENVIWYEFVGEQFRRLLMCDRGKESKVFRASILERRIYKYDDDDLDPKVQQEALDRTALMKVRKKLRAESNETGFIEAVYKISLKGGGIVWVKDQAVVEFYPADHTSLSLGCLMLVTKEMEVEEQLKNTQPRYT